MKVNTKNWILYIVFVVTFGIGLWWLVIDNIIMISGFVRTILLVFTVMGFGIVYKILFEKRIINKLNGQG